MIVLQNLSKKFDHRGIAGVHGIDLHLKKGEILALMGPNGSGKSTLLNIMSGKIKPDMGSIAINGKIHSISNKDLPDHLNVQKCLIQSVIQDIDDEKKIQLSRDMADIFEFTFQLRQNLGQLSQGQRQKVLIASELINSPEIVFLDEPFNHLDPFTRQEILNDMFTYLRNKEVSVIWVTHDSNEALRFADRISIMNFGKIEQTSSPEEICFKPRNLFVAQFMGHKNFIPITKLSLDKWQTPWGEKSFDEDLDHDTVLLCIPPYAWKIDSTSNFQVEIIQRYVGHLVWEVTSEWNSKRLVLHFPPSILIWNEEKKLRIVPCFEHCFLIPL